MPDPRPDVMDFLLTRRSRPAKTIVAPAPDRKSLEAILTAALRVPDHGKLEPWRLIVLEGAALTRLADAAITRAARLGIDPEKAQKHAAMFRAAPMIVAVASVPVPSEKVPQVEQILSAGALCLGLVNAALASGWAANWLTGWSATDEGFVQEALGLAAGAQIAGYVVLGSETARPPERPRPDPGRVVSWVDR